MTVNIDFLTIAAATLACETHCGRLCLWLLSLDLWSLDTACSDLSLPGASVLFQISSSERPGMLNKLLYLQNKGSCFKMTLQLETTGEITLAINFLLFFLYLKVATIILVFLGWKFCSLYYLN